MKNESEFPFWIFSSEVNYFSIVTLFFEGLWGQSKISSGNVTLQIPVSKSLAFEPGRPTMNTRLMELKQTY